MSAEPVAAAIRSRDYTAISLPGKQHLRHSGNQKWIQQTRQDGKQCEDHQMPA